MSFPNGGELLVLLVLVLVVVGPERLPRYSQQLADLVRSGVRYAKGARDSLKEEMGPEFDDIDWKKLDPRQYDPRRIVRDALTDVWDEPATKRPGAGGPQALTAPAAGGAAGGAAAAAASRSADGVAGTRAGAATGGATGAGPASAAPAPGRRGATGGPGTTGARGPAARTPYDDEAT
ncbi:hypothetical protein WDV85_02015 [Pseudokineococcus sp. 5B2Z-1]|uniref:hypothetical protein n=1 Tax=Pseudokineococcus sp. 5B2Z-1 TaxID=3132744 RepID=UPI0030AAC961